MLKIPPIYAQGDNSWGRIMLGTSVFNMAGSGCYLTCLTMVGDAFGYNLTPGDYVNQANDKGMIDAGGETNGWRISEIFPTIQETKSDETDLTQTKDNTVKIADAIATIQQSLDRGAAVLFHVDLSPYNNINKGDHFVYCVSWNFGDPKIIDPFFGTLTTLSEKYGKPEKAIMGYRIFELKTNVPMSKHLNIDDNTFVSLVEGSGGFGRYDKVKDVLYVDDTAKLLAQWFGNTKGNVLAPRVSIGLKDWNLFTRKDLKNNNLN
jgi:hypothetical protein